MAMKVLTMLAGASVGGAETFFVSLTSALAKAGPNVRSVLKSNDAREAALAKRGIKFDTAPFGSLLDLTTRGVLRRAILEARG